MAFGWKRRFPLKFGGGTSNTIQAAYDTVVQNRPEILRGGGDATEVECENRMLARMLALGWRDTQRRLAQVDPRWLSDKRRPVKDPETGAVELLSLLERWERILVIRPSHEASVHERRAAVFGRVRGFSSNARPGVENAMRGVFGSWFTGVFENTIDQVHYVGKVPPGPVKAYWGTSLFTFTAEYPGQYDASKPWTSMLAIINVGFKPPASTSQASIDVLVGKALDTLDDMLPSWMSAVLSQWGPTQTSPGFFAGVSLVGLTGV